MASDLIGSIAGRLAGFKNILWNIRYSNLEIKKTKLKTIFILKILAKLSYFIPELIITVSKRAKNTYLIENYDKKKIRFIPNGYDMSILKSNKYKKKIFRKEIKLKNKIPLLGCVARYDKQKDHLNLLNSLAIFVQVIKFYCILVGNTFIEIKI